MEIECCYFGETNAWHKDFYGIPSVTALHLNLIFHFYDFKVQIEEFYFVSCHKISFKLCNFIKNIVLD